MYRGAVTAAQSYGVGNFEANSVMVGWSSKPERASAYFKMLQDLVMLDKTVLIASWHDEKKLGAREELQIWLGGDERTQAMLLLFSHLLTSHYRFRDMETTVFVVAEDDQDKLEAQSRLARLLKEARIEADTRVILRQGRSLKDIMHVECDDADLALVGIDLPARDVTDGDPYRTSDQAAKEFRDEIAGLLEELPTTLLLRSADSFEHEQVLLDRE